MKKFFRAHKGYLVCVLISLSVFGITALLYSYTKLFDIFELATVDFRYYIKDPTQKSEKIEPGARMYKKNPEASEDIVILSIDEETIREFDNTGVHWPFPWSYHNKVLNFAKTGNPNTIFFDVMFLDHKYFEEELAASMKEAGNVVVDYAFEKEEYHNKVSDAEERIQAMQKFSFDLDPDDESDIWVEEAVPPTPLIVKSVKSVGFANHNPDYDNISREIPLLLKFNGRYYPSAVLSIVMNYYNISNKDVEIKMGRYIKLMNIDMSKSVNGKNEVIIPVDKNANMIVNFVGAIGSYESIPYYYFYRDDALGVNQLQNKIVMIGAFSVQGIASDNKQTPYGDMFGIEFLANAVNTIINNNFLYRLTTQQNLIIMFIIAVFLGAVISKINMIWSFIITILTLITYLLINHVMFDSYRLLYAYTTPSVQIVMTYASIVVYRYLTEQREKKYIRQTFSKFVSKAVVDDLLKNPEKIKLGGEKKILTVLFSDVRGFTTISEQLTPEALVEHLNEYLQAMTDLVFKYDGTLDKYVGDELMAFWGAPVPQEDHALNACKAAIEMIDILIRMNQNWENIGKPRLEIGIGINTGDMVVGNMGSHSRMDYTLMGDNVNLGARLEGTNKVYNTRIIISEFTYEHVKDKVIVRELDLIRVKGKLHPVTIYELIDIIDHKIV